MVTLMRASRTLGSGAGMRGGSAVVFARAFVAQIPAAKAGDVPWAGVVAPDNLGGFVLTRFLLAFTNNSLHKVPGPGKRTEGSAVGMPDITPSLARGLALFLHPC